jgi:signal transduction histidine kinase
MQERYQHLRSISENLIFKNEILKMVGEIGQLGIMRKRLDGEVEWSDETFTILGLDKSLVKPSRELLIETTHQEDKKRLEDAIKSLEYEDHFKLDFRIATKGEEEKHCLLFCELQKKLFISHGVRLFQAIIIDTTQKNINENLRVERDAANKANKAKSIFLANISHEIRTPMHGILSFARFGLKKVEESSKDKLKTYFTEIYDSSLKLMDLLNEILDLSKLESGKQSNYTMKYGNIKNIAYSVCHQMGSFAQEKGLNIVVVEKNEEICSFFDEERIVQVFRNLVTNAIKFSTQGDITVHIYESQGLITCEVVNKGVGIPHAELQQIFDKFFQSSKTRTGAGGTGLGLAICREIIHGHKGKIWAESESDGKTRFIFEIPKVESIDNSIDN